MEILLVLLAALLAVGLLYLLVSFGVLGSGVARSRSDANDDRRDSPPGRTRG